MIDSNHGAVLEHGTIYLHLQQDSILSMDNLRMDMYMRYKENKFSVARMVGTLAEGNENLYVTTNFRVIIENGWLDDLRFICAPTEFHEKRYTFWFTTDMGVAKGFNRHRVHSIAEESTRYCNYAKDKFGNEVLFIYLPWCNTDDAVEPEHTPVEGDMILPYDTSKWNAIDWWLWGISCCEEAYMRMISLGWTPQQARAVLPQNTKAETVHTAFASDWKHFIDLRSIGTTGAPHPQTKQLGDEIKKWYDENDIEEERNAWKHLTPPNGWEDNSPRI
jgi:thymidylate synthase (FAD)